MRRTQNLSATLLAFSLLTGCASLGKLGRTIVPPSALANPISETVAPPFPETWQALTRELARGMVDDAVFNALITKLAANPSIGSAKARVSEAQARLSAARTGLLPSTTVTSSASSGSTQPGGTGATSANLGLSIALPLDLAGGTRARINAQAARSAAASFDLARTEIATAQAFGQLYSAYRTAQTAETIAQRGLETAQDSLGLAETRQRAGLETGLGVAQARTARDSARARIAPFTQSKVAARLGLEALVGQLPGSLTATLSPDGPIPQPNARGLIETPAALLQKRPDLQAAAQRLKAFGLDAQAAQRDRLPSFTLSGLLSQTASRGRIDGGLGNMTTTLLSPIFDFGRLEALAKAAGFNAQAESELYRGLVLGAYSEVETLANRITNARANQAAQVAALASARDQAGLARIRYTSGLTSFLDVLTAEQAVVAAETALALAQGDASDAGFALVAALGGLGPQ